MQVDADRSWFLYVGEIKAAGLNRFLVEPLSRRYGKPAVCINIVPDVLAFYPEDVFMVVGPGSDQAGPDSDIRRNSRISVPEFASLVSADETVKAVVSELLDKQGELFVNVFESSVELDLVSDERIRIIGPDPQVAVAMNNKLHQLEMAADLGLPVPNGASFQDRGEALEYSQGIFGRGRKAFVSGAYSAGGSHSIVASTVDEIVSRFEDPTNGLLITEFIEHEHDPTVLGIVAGPDNVYIASVADQNIHGTRFLGSTFPTVLGEETVDEIKEITRTVGTYLGQKGYRGIFGCDFIVDERMNVFFVELNARKQGTTMETSLVMAHNLPGRPVLPELEMLAVMEGRLPDDLTEMSSTHCPLCWGTYNFKASGDCLIGNYVPPSMEEEDLFTEAMSGRSGHVVLDHVGPRTHITAGGFVARVVAAGPTPGDVKKGLRAGVQQVQMSTK